MSNLSDYCDIPISPEYDGDSVVFNVEMSNFTINMFGDGMVLLPKMETFKNFIFKQIELNSNLIQIINPSQIDYPRDTTVIRFTYNTHKNNLIYVRYSCGCGVLL